MSENAFGVRIAQLERRVDGIERTKPEVQVERIDALREDVQELRGELRGLKRAFYTFALSVAGSAIVFAFTVLQVWGD